MKKKLMCMLIIFIMMLIIPIIVAKNKETDTIIKNKNPSYGYTKNKIYSLVAQNFKPEYKTETLKALTVIIQTNYTLDKKLKNETKNINVINNQFIKIHKNNSDKYFKKIKKAVNNVFNQEILVSGRKKFIPFDYVMKKGKNNDYPYIKSCATPWDEITQEYKNLKSSEGISINSLNKLSENDFTYRESLMFFIKNAEITKSDSYDI